MPENVSITYYIGIEYVVFPYYLRLSMRFTCLECRMDLSGVLRCVGSV